MRHLHGHNAKAVITVEAPSLDALGMVVDFSIMKNKIGRWINDTLDHTMLLHRDDPVAMMLKEMNERHYLLDVNPTAENLAKLIYDHAIEQGFPVAEVTLWETENLFATYRGK